MINPFIFCPNLPNSKGTQNNSLIVGKPGKGTKIHFFKESNFKPELAPKEAKVEHVKIDGNNLVVMSY
ncbi:hypothetical protein [Bacillus pseudomycoides]|uniref:hypothetical protein n=1 Tax=Bacillus pseudomycoides TaxID=64104 RepID=UPI0005013448|nr:hypothetical protein [Bacillus pseudomycoides]KFN13770.1 hypothetical protein DJ94_4488 [Bacillus pseudomycoides]MDR4188024.1 hypothetical protein [Bacillus pseudomycoides]MED0858104.1 hypothetical protein [Bacillus pseudomycoides]PEK70485.1 hypothetical protein CN593_05565 [Bacillus pseudomycoides]PFW93878.1 hypothetical protein COL29_12095 [Bacillus pseudomycoides]